MKRITTILSFLMLVCMGTWATDITSFSNGVYYIHNNANSNKYVSSTYVCKSSSTYGCQFYIKQVTHNNKTCYTIYNLDNNAYVNYKDTKEETTKLENGSLGDKSYWDITFVSGAAVTISPQGTSVSWNFWGGNSDNNPVGLYRNSDGNSKWLLESVGIVTSATGFGNFKYTVSSSNRGSWAVNGASAFGLSSTGSLGLAPSQTDTKQQFAFVSYNDKYYLYSIVAQKFVLKNGTLVEGPTAEQSIDPLTVTTTGNESYPLFFKFDNSHNINLGGSNQIAINTWGTIDAGNSMAVLPAGNYDLTDAVNVLKGAVSVTYNVIMEANGSSVIPSTTVTSYRGRSLELPSAMKRGYCTYNLYTDAACTSAISSIPANYAETTLTVYAKCTYDGPVTFSTIESPIYYNLQTASSKYAYNNAGALAQADVLTVTDNYMWAFVGTPYSFKILNKGSNKYLTNATPTTDGTAGSFTDDGTVFAMYQNNQGNTNHFSITVASTGVSSILNPTASSINFYYSTGVNQTDGAITNMETAFVYPIEASTAASITYVLKNTSLSNVNVVATAGDALSAPSAWARDGVVFSYYSDEDLETSITTAVVGNQTVYVGYTYSLASIVSDDTENLKWYRLAASSQGAYWDLYYNGSAPYPYKGQSAFDGSNGYFWAFVGDPFNGFKIYNKAVATTSTMIHNNNTQPAMGTDDGTRWYITINSGMIGFQYTGNTGHRWNDYGGGAASLKYFSNESWHQYTNINDVDYSGLVTKNIQPYVDNCGDGYFKITSSSASAMADAITGANEDETVTLAEYQQLVNTLTAMIVWPTTGYYRIKSVSAETYLKATNADQLNVGGTNSEVASIVYLTRSAGNYTMQMQGKYVAIQANGNATHLVDGTVTNHFTVPTNASGVVQPGQAIIGGGLTATDYMRVDNSNVVGVAMGQSPIGNNACYWTVEPATSATVSLTPIGDNTYATTYLPFDVTVSGSDVTANAVVVADVHVGYVVPTALEDNKIPAGTPVILKGSSTSATSATLTINKSSAFSAISETSALEGVYVNTDFALTDGSTADYFLGMLDGALGFYHSGIASKTGYYTLSANRAYLPASKLPAASRGFAIKWSDDDVTGIRAIDNGKQVQSNGVYYDLSGRRVENPQHGMYIVNGRVVVIK